MGRWLPDAGSVEFLCESDEDALGPTDITDSADSRTQDVVRTWLREFADAEVKAARLLAVIGPLLDVEADGSRSSVTMLGGQLKKLNGSIVDGFEIVGREVSGSMSWRLIQRK